mgnify:CR=1 FL=1
MNRRRRRSNPIRIILLVVLVGVGLYVNQVVVPATPPLFVPTPTPTRSPESFAVEAKQFAVEGKMAQAILSYEEAVQSDPKNANNYVELARLQVYAGKYAEAVTSAENALLLNPNHSMASALRGWALSYMEEYLPAEAAFKRALEIDPNNAAAYAYQAEMLASQVSANLGDLGTLDKAVAASRMAQQIDPNLMETRRARGIVLELTGNYAEAAAEFEAAVAINPNLADLHLALGRNYRQLEDYARAIEEFNRANALNPADPLPDTYIARTYVTVGEYGKAIQYAEQAVKDAAADPYMWGNLGTMYYRNQQFNEALNPLALAVKGGRTPEGVEVQGLPLDYGRIAEYYYLYGLAAARTGECGVALPIAQALMEGVPDDQISVDNADAMITICQEIADGTYQLAGEEDGEEGAEGEEGESDMTTTPESADITPTP